LGKARTDGKHAMILGIDLGTSMVKAARFALDGTCLAVASRRSSPTSLGGGRIEQDFEEIVTAVGEVVTEVCAGAPPPLCIGLTGQSDGLWLLDAEGRGVRPAVSWLDDRGNPYLERWIASGAFAEVFRRNANAIFPGSHAPLMAALKDSDPEALARAHTASYLKDGILQRLTGVRVTDASDASLPFLNTVTREYAPEILRLLGLEDMRRLLAPVMPAPGQAFALNAAGAALTGLAEGIPVHAGPFDLVACCVGAGLRRVGDGLVIIGTTLACSVLSDRIDTAADPVGMTLCMPEEGRWIRSMPATVGTATLDWVLGLVGATHDQVDALLAQSRPGANGATALPYFSATGERAPFVEVRARGQAGLDPRPGADLGGLQADARHPEGEKSWSPSAKKAGCPNVGECWSAGHATMMIMGEICTRGCTFCNVATGKPAGAGQLRAGPRGACGGRSWAEACRRSPRSTATIWTTAGPSISPRPSAPSATAAPRPRSRCWCPTS
jgi:erythritol kinase